MGIVNVHAPDYATVAASARAGGAGVTQRENMQQSQQLAQRDRLFYAGIANENAQREAQRNASAAQQQAENVARLEQERIQGANAIAELDKRNEVERSNVEWTFSKKQEQEKKQYQSQLDLVDELYRNGEFDDVQARDAKFKITEKLMGIKPIAQPKVNPLEQYPVVAGPGDRKYHVVPGRNGKPEYVPQDPTELDPKTAAKKDSDEKKLVAAQEKEQRAAAAEEKKFTFERRKQAFEEFSKLTETDEEGKPKMSREEAMAISGYAEFLPQPPVQITNDAAGQQAFMALPSGAKYLAPDGTTRTKR